MDERCLRCLRSGNFLKTSHTKKKMQELKIDDKDLMHILKYGEEAHQSGTEDSKNFIKEITGETIDGQQLGVLVEYRVEKIILTIL